MAVSTGKIVLMGSGELTATMVEVHKWLLARLGPSPLAIFIDTPAGFQGNVEQISQRAADYFSNNVRHPLQVASFKSASDISELAKQQALGLMREADYMLIGPGSPTYAVRQWQDSVVPELLSACVQGGGTLVAASAAALTVGRFTLPVYEIYKVGEKLHWLPGLDILRPFGLDLVVVPHWNNAEGGNHDTRYCFMGLERFQKLEEILPEDVPVLGLDEHTACIIDLATKIAEVRGIGQVTFRNAGAEVCFEGGESFPLSALQSADIFSGVDTKVTEPELPPSTASIDNADFWQQLHALENVFTRAR